MKQILKKVKNSFCNVKYSKLVATVYGVMLTLLPSYALGARTWPWTGILNDIKAELTGPLPMTLGVLGIVVAMVGLFAGNAGDGMRRVLVIILAISIALFAPTLVEWIAESAG